ncbi:MAG: hypothetical protein WCQ32_01585 [bacterium]
MLERFEKALHSQENPTNEKGYEPSLKEVLKKKEDSDLFGELLKREGKINLATRLAKGELTESDIEELDEYRTDFMGSMDRVKTVKESISKELIHAYTRHNSDLQKVISLVGVDEYESIVKDKLARLSITAPDDFEALYRSVESKNDYKDGYYKNLDERVVALCKEKKINPEEYFKAILVEDPDEREEALRTVVRKGYSWFGKATDWLSKGAYSRDDRDTLTDTSRYIFSANDDMRDAQGEVGYFLAALTSNEVIRNAVSKEIIGDPANKEVFEGFSTIKNEQPTKEKVQLDWNSYKAQVKDWADLTPDDQDMHRESFLDTQKELYEKQQSKKTSFWSSIFGSFFDLFATINKDSLK